MDSTDYKIIKGQLATKIGKAVAQFVREVGVDNLTIYVAVDKPMASFFEDGSSNGMTRRGCVTFTRGRTMTTAILSPNPLRSSALFPPW